MKGQKKSTDDLKSKYEDDLGTPESNFTTTILPSKLRKHQLLSVKVDNDNSGIRYRKVRNKNGGNEKDHWKEENLIHMVCIFTAVKLNGDLRVITDFEQLGNKERYKLPHINFGNKNTFKNICNILISTIISISPTEKNSKKCN